MLLHFSFVPCAGGRGRIGDRFYVRRNEHRIERAIAEANPVVFNESEGFVGVTKQAFAISVVTREVMVDQSGVVAVRGGRPDSAHPNLGRELVYRRLNGWKKRAVD